jgi:ribonuclease D
VLLGIAVEPPQNVQALAARKGVGSQLIERHGRSVMEAVQRGLDSPRDQWPRVPRPKRWPRDEDYETRFKRLKQCRDELTARHDLRMGIVASNQLLTDIARALPGDLDALGSLPGIRRYQVANFGEALLHAL